MARYTTTLNEYINSELGVMGQDEFIDKEGNLIFFDEDFQFIQKILKYDDDVHNIVTNKIFKGYALPNNNVDKFFKKSFIMRFLDREIGRQTIESFASQVLYVTLTHQEYIQTVFGSEYQKYFEQHVDYNTDTIGNTVEQSTEHGETKQTQENNTKETHSDNANETHEDHTTETHSDTTNETHSDTSTTEGQSITDDRSAETTLPQSEVNINVNNDELSYADTNNISKNKGTSSTDVDSSGKSENKNTGNRNTDSNGESESSSNGNRNSDFNGLTDGLSDSERNAQSDNTSNTQSLTKTYLLDNLKAIYDMKDQLYNTYDKKCFLHIW